jgi:3-deoxy-D-manno-octulosonate 8-phosphate phosphatase (KDO 8-P phosphatase)
MATPSGQLAFQQMTSGAARSSAHRELPAERWSAIKLLCCDVDGVLTDGSLSFDENGHLIQTFFVRDGFGLVAARRAGLLIAWVSGRASRVAQKRFEELGLLSPLCLLDCDDKAAAIRNLQEQYELDESECCFIGDDIPDMAAFSVCGLKVAVADAIPALAERADYITRAPGGRGAVREIIDHILLAQGYWGQMIEMFTKADEGAIDHEASDDMQR